MNANRRLVSAALFVGTMLGVVLTWLCMPAARRAYADSLFTATSSGMKTYALRLTPGQDLKKALLGFARQEGLQAPVILTCVGSLTDVNLRFANQEQGTVRSGHFEILSLVGLLDPAGGHLHLCAADKDGVSFGGHVLDGCRVYTTAEVVIGDLVDFEFKRELDKTYGFKELTVHPREKR